MTYVEELRQHGVCRIQPAANQHSAGEIEICDGFWPYEKARSSTKTDTVAGYIEQTRRKCVNLAHLLHDFTAEPGGYAKVEKEVPEAQLLALESTFCPLARHSMLQAAETIVRVYKEIAPPLADEHGIEYPTGLEQVLLKRLERLGKPG